MQDWGRIAVGCRIGRCPDAMFVTSWTRLITRGLQNKDVVLDPTIELPHHYAAECMVASFIKSKADTLLMLDDDMVFGYDDLGRLRGDKRGWKYDMLGAMYQSRKPPHHPICIEHSETSPTGYANNICPAPDTLHDVGVVGLGFTLIRRSILEKIALQKPQKEFMFYWHINGDSEDTCFCRRVEAAGGTIGLHSGVAVGHRMGVVLRWDAKERGVKLFTRGMKEDK